MPEPRVSWIGLVVFSGGEKNTGVIFILYSFIDVVYDLKLRPLPWLPFGECNNSSHFVRLHVSSVYAAYFILASI